MTNTIKVSKAAKDDKTAIMMVENLEAAATPMRPMMNAKRANPPAIGWRMRM